MLYDRFEVQNQHPNTNVSFEISDLSRENGICRKGKTKFSLHDLAFDLAMSSQLLRRTASRVDLRIGRPYTDIQSKKQGLQTSKLPIKQTCPSATASAPPGKTQGQRREAQRC